MRGRIPMSGLDCATGAKSHWRNDNARGAVGAEEGGATWG